MYMGMLTPWMWRGVSAVLRGGRCTFDVRGCDILLNIPEITFIYEIQVVTVINADEALILL